MKVCPRVDPLLVESTHTHASREELHARLIQERLLREENSDPWRVVFERTMGKVAAFFRYGCGAPQDCGTTIYDVDRTHDEDWEHALWLAAEEKGRRGYAPSEAKCQGKLMLSYNFEGNPYIQ